MESEETGVSSSVLLGAGAEGQVLCEMLKYGLLIPQEQVSGGLPKLIRLGIFM